MGWFEFNQNEFLSFFAVLVRFSALLAVFPFIGEKVIPAQARILLALAITFSIYPVLVSTGRIDPERAAVWGATGSGIVSTIALEVLFALALGFTTKIIFDAIQVGADIIGHFMGFSMASQFDPRQESQTLLLAQFHSAIAMLLFLALDGHHIMFRAAVESFRVVGIGEVKIGAAFAEKLVALTNQILRTGLQLAAPMAMALFSVNIVYGVLAKAMPQLNVLVLSFSVSSLVGMFVMILSFPELHHVTVNIFENMGQHLSEVMVALSDS